MTAAERRLAADFPAATEADWRAAVARVLKGAPFSTLVGETDDGIPVQPLYAAAPGTLTTGASAGRRWRVAARVDHPTPREAAALALADLEGGADALVLTMAGSGAARGRGVPNDAAALDAALAGVELDLVDVRLDLAGGTPGETEPFLAMIRRRGYPAATVNVDFGIDPLGGANRTGRMREPWRETARALARTVVALREAGFAGPVLTADGRGFHEAGAGEAQELGYVLATLVAYLRALAEEGLAAGEGGAALSAILAADADQVLTIAKFRALRRLWARVEDACGLARTPLRIHGETSWRMMTRRDPWVNVLRATAAAFAAGVGGADGVVVLPFTEALGLPDAFARRLARNTQLVLLEEANLWRVADPAAGAGAFETLTDQLCLRAWAIFQDVERGGGMAEAIAGGGIAAALGASRARLQRAVATGAKPITGTSAFPDLAEGAVAVLECPRPAAPSIPPADASVRSVPQLPSFRLSEPFEALRDRVDARAARGPGRPTVFLARLGGSADAAASAGFARSLFAAGGIAAAGGEEAGESADALLRAFRASGARLACVCVGPDALAENLAEDLVRALARAGAAAIAFAGAGETEKPALEAAGVAHFVFAGCDAPALLDACLAALDEAEAA